MDWLFSNPQSLSFSQVVLDVLLIGLILVFLFLNRSRGPVRGVKELSESLEKFIEEAQGLSEEFEVNLKQRRVIIQQVVSQLDTRVQQAQKLRDQLEELQKKVQPSVSFSNSNSPSTDHSEILALSRRGMDAQTISQRLKKPIGEVELILSLQKLSSSDS